MRGGVNSGGIFEYLPNISAKSHAKHSTILLTCNSRGAEETPLTRVGLITDMQATKIVCGMTFQRRGRKPSQAKVAQACEVILV